MTSEYKSPEDESLQQLCEKYSLDKNIVNQYAEEFAKLEQCGVRDIKYDFVEGTSAQERLEGALSVARAINGGQYDTVFEGTVEDALNNLDSVVSKLSQS